MEAPIVNNVEMQPTRPRAAVFACAVLAVASTGLSVSISAASGWNRGDTGLNAWLWAALGVLATFSAHLLPAASRLGNWRMKALTWILWICCFTFAAITHASYYLGSQTARGEQRATTVASPSKEGRRPLSKVMMEKGEIDARIATMTRATCAPECTAMMRKRAQLRAQSMALEQEEMELRRLAADDEVARLATAQAKNDPAVWAAASMLGIPPARLQHGLAALAGILVDGTACLSWTLLLLMRPARRHTVATGADVHEGVTSECAAKPVSHGTVDAGVTESHPAGDPQALSDQLRKVREAIEAGTLRKTVRAIRAHLECGQDRAMTVYRRLDGVPIRGNAA